LIPDRSCLIDYHVHPYYSLDAEGTVDEYCQRAVSLGLSEIGFTPHLELDARRRALDDKVRVGGRIVSMRSGWLSTFAEDVEKAREKYPIQTRMGVEVGYGEDIEEEIGEVLDTYPFDFCLGAVHCLDHVAITDRREYELYYRNRLPDEVLQSYFSVLRKAMDSQLFDGIAHFDIYKKYGLKYYGDVITELEDRFIEDALDCVAAHGIALEINMSGVRKTGSPYPSESILRLARKMGVSRVMIGSDCHKVADLGCGLEDALELVQSLGFALCGWRNREAYRIEDGVE
jgi:histidinol-phosphatase (PHP family)